MQIPSLPPPPEILLSKTPFSKTAKFLFDKENYSDFQIVNGSYVFYVHKFIISTKWDFLKFYDSRPIITRNVEFPQKSLSEFSESFAELFFRKILRYIYTGKVHFFNLQDAVWVLFLKEYDFFCFFCKINSCLNSIDSMFYKNVVTFFLMITVFLWKNVNSLFPT